MSKLLTTAGATLAAALFALPVGAQTMGTSPSNSTMHNNAATTGTMATGTQGAMNTSPSANDTYKTADNKLRLSKVIGASVYNDQNQKVGSVDDVLVPGTSSTSTADATAVISVGGFLGMGSKLVTVPYSKLQVANDKIIMPGASKDALNGMPTYHYTNG